MFKSCKHDSAAPVVAVAAGRGVVGSINFALIALASGIIRNEIRMGGTGEGIDAYNELRSGQAAAEEDDRQMEEQGASTRMNPMVLGGMLRAVRGYLCDDMVAVAPKVELVLSKKVVPDPYACGDRITDTLDFQISREPRGLTAAMKAEAKALNISEEELMQGFLAQNKNNVAFLATNRSLVLECIERMTFENPDTLGAEGIYDKLPAINRLRLLAACDAGLMRRATQEKKRHIVWRQADALGNVALLEGERRELRKRINAWLAESKVKREIKEELDRGVNLPVLNDLPVIPKDEAAKKAA